MLHEQNYPLDLISTLSYVFSCSGQVTQGPRLSILETYHLDKRQMEGRMKVSRVSLEYRKEKKKCKGID